MTGHGESGGGVRGARVRPEGTPACRSGAAAARAQTLGDERPVVVPDNHSDDVGRLDHGSVRSRYPARRLISGVAAYVTELGFDLTGDLDRWYCR
jgi:hypothetical protein